MEIPIDRGASNAFMVYGCTVSAKEMCDHGPHIWSTLPQYERKVDCLGMWSTKCCDDWKASASSEKEIDDEFDHYNNTLGYGLPSVGVNDDKYLNSAEKEFLLWHWKLGIGT